MSIISGDFVTRLSGGSANASGDASLGGASQKKGGFGSLFYALAIGVNPDKMPFICRSKP